MKDHTYFAPGLRYRITKGNFRNRVVLCLDTKEAPPNPRSWEGPIVIFWDEDLQVEFSALTAEALKHTVRLKHQTPADGWPERYSVMRHPRPCAGWNVGIARMDSGLRMAAMNGNPTTLVPFKYCPWCAAPIKLTKKKKSHEPKHAH